MISFVKNLKTPQFSLKLKVNFLIIACPILSKDFQTPNLADNRTLSVIVYCQDPLDSYEGVNVIVYH